MTSQTAPKPHWINRIGAAVALWATVCGVGLLGGMSPRPLLLAGLIGALSILYWLAADSLNLAEPTDWQITEDLVTRARGGDSRVVMLEHVVTDSRASAVPQRRLHHLLSDLADERLLSLRGIDRHTDPLGARAALGPELDDFITTFDAGRSALTPAQISSLLNRIESL